MMVNQSQIGGFSSFMMILFTFDDGKGAVELFDEYHSYHLMGEGHLRERQLFVGSVVYGIRETVRTADDEHHVSAHCLLFLLHPSRQFYAAHFLPVFVEQHHMVACLYLLEYQFSLHLLLLLLR